MCVVLTNFLARQSCILHSKKFWKFIGAVSWVSVAANDLFSSLQRNRLINVEFGKLRAAQKKAGAKPKRVNKKPHLKAA